MTLLPLEDRSSAGIRSLLQETSGEFLFITDPRYDIDVSRESLRRLRDAGRALSAGIVYADGAGEPRIDYQAGSLRDTFDFGPLLAVHRETAIAAMDGDGDDFRWCGLYDLRLRISQRAPVVRVPEPLYASSLRLATSGDAHFAYVDPRNRDYQMEAERVATAQLRRTRAYLEPRFETPPQDGGAGTTATVVIPVRNRERTVGEAVRSALEQVCSFAYNVIVVENHSTDSTRAILESLRDSRLRIVVPDRTGLGIGGCWNVAVHHPECGRYAVQLDSDDLYRAGALQRIVDAFDGGRYAMVVGSYTLVDFSLREVPPGLIDHREWTRENGRNNLLRVNGLGAPRAYQTRVIRETGFPDVSYGEDYAVGLAISRRFEIGRIYDSLYWCRRWEGNSDNALPRETANRYDFYKDWLRTIEIRARQTHASR